MSTVNKDYIGIIKNVNGCVKFVKEEIKHKTALINELRAMIENPNRSIFDLKSRMDREFSQSERKFINYVSPYSYSSTYINGVSYPEVPSYDEHHEEIQQKTLEYTKMYEEKYESLKTKSLQEFRDRVNESVQRDIDSLIEYKKQEYFNMCTRYCQAFSYASLLSELQADPDVKMWSTETVGWTNFSYSITDDIRIDVHTNFGYGWSSYFYLGLTYKGIDILPYIFFVKYYYANRWDIARYTRRYEVEHKSWDYAFDYVETLAAKAAEGDETFASEYVANEVQEMLTRLRNILDDPKTYFDGNIACMNTENDSHYLTVRNMSAQEMETYAAYPHEMIDVFQAEKIAGALDFLVKITALEPIYDQAISAADEIRDIAQKLLPQINANMARITTDVESLQLKEGDLLLQIESLDREIEPHTSIINALYEKACSEAEEGKVVDMSDIKNKYSSEHPEYKTLVERRNETTNKLYNVRREKSDRQSFWNRLEQCRKEIQSGAVTR